jgi:hypothetical protein
MKTCSKCGEAKSLSGFGCKSLNKDGRSGTCKKCKSAMDAEYAKKYEPAAFSGWEPEMTIRDVAAVMGISHQAVSMIENRALYKLRAALENQGIHNMEIIA